MPTRAKFLSGAFSAALFFLSTFILFTPLAGPAEAARNAHIVPFAISAYTVVILLAWLAGGLIAGGFATVLAVGAAWFFDLQRSFYGSPAFVLQFVLAFTIGYGYHALRSAADRAAALRLEKINDEMNELSTAVEERTKSIRVLVGKVLGYSALKGVVESFSTSLSTDEINALILDKALETLDKHGRALLYLVDVEKQELILSASRNEARVKAKKGDVFDQWVLRHRRSLMVEDVTKDFRFPTREAEDASAVFVSLIAAPLISEDKVIGIVRMDSPEGSFYTQDDLRLLDIVANLGAVALQNAFLYARTQELAIHDGLTGLFVRRYFMERFSEELKRTAMKKGDLAVLILDIDHFKDYNDRYGHTAGDLVLKHLAKIVSAVSRDGDIVARYGGEELVMVLAGRPWEQAVLEAEALRHAIADSPFQLRRHRTTITASIGIAHYPVDAVTEEGLLGVADDRLYTAKRQGRNRVCSRT